MLTDSEREWLENRKPGDWCVTHDCSAMFEGECISVTCYMDISWLYRDAAEFAERVAAKLARWDNEYHKDDHLCPYGDTDLDSYVPICHCTDFCKDHPKLGCVSVKIAWARLAVEEEMDGSR